MLFALSPIGFGLHMLAMLAFGIGVLFLLFWAYKHLSEKDLWKWGWVFVIGGLVLCVLSIGTLNGGMMYHKGNRMYFNKRILGPGEMMMQTLDDETVEETSASSAQ